MKQYDGIAIAFLLSFVFWIVVIIVAMKMYYGTLG